MTITLSSHNSKIKLAPIVEKTYELYMFKTPAMSCYH